MEGIIVVGVLVLAAAALFGLGAWQTARALTARNEQRRADAELSAAYAAATWQVDVRHRGDTTQVILVRAASTEHGWRTFDEPVVVASISQASDGYEVELDRAGATARQRAGQLNAFRTRQGPA